MMTALPKGPIPPCTAIVLLPVIFIILRERHLDITMAPEYGPFFDASAQ